MASENGLGNLARPSAASELVPLDEICSPNALTLPTNALATGGDAQVIALKQMAVLAMGFACVVVSAVADRIQRVIAACTPRQILQGVVRLVVVQVPAHQPFRSGADERLQDEDVDSVSSAIGKRDEQPPSATVYWLEQATGRTHFTVGADFVAIESGNGLPHVPILEANNAK